MGKKRLSWYSFLLLKAYFDKGIGLTSYMKYLIAIFGFVSYVEKIDMKILLAVGIIYTIGCFFIGWLWYKYKLIHVENEISNKFNPFQIEVRNALRMKKFKYK